MSKAQQQVCSEIAKKWSVAGLRPVGIRAAEVQARLSRPWAGTVEPGCLRTPLLVC